MEDIVTTGLRRLLRREKLEEPGWALRLGEYDEPPLFPWIEDVEFLRELEPDDRGHRVLAFMVQQLDALYETLGLPAGENRFVCLSIHGWDLYQSDEAAFPKPCFLLFADAEREMSDFSVYPVVSERGVTVQRWLDGIPGATRLLVCESDAQDDDTVFIGTRSSESSRSTPIEPYLVKSAVDSRGGCLEDPDESGL